MLFGMMLFCALRMVNLHLRVWRTLGELSTSAAFEAFLVVRRLVLGKRCLKLPSPLHVYMFMFDLYFCQCFCGLKTQLLLVGVRHPLHFIARLLINLVMGEIHSLILQRNHFGPGTGSIETSKTHRGNTHLHNGIQSNREWNWGQCYTGRTVKARRSYVTIPLEFNPSRTERNTIYWGGGNYIAVEQENGLCFSHDILILYRDDTIHLKVGRFSVLTWTERDSRALSVSELREYVRRGYDPLVGDFGF